MPPCLPSYNPRMSTLARLSAAANAYAPMTMPAAPPPSPVLQTAASMPPEGDFRMSADSYLLKNTYDAITMLKLWEWLAKYDPPADKGFMFSHTPELKAITTATEEVGHSGASFAMTMRHMQLIAKKGWLEYCRNQMFALDLGNY